MKSSYLLSFCLFLTSLWLTGCSTPTSFTDFTTDLFVSEISANTINLHYTLEDPKAYGITDYPITLGQYSWDTAEQKDYLERLQFRLMSYSFTDFTLEEQLTYDIFRDYLDSQLGLCDFALYDEPLSFSNGMQMQLPILLAEYELDSATEVEEYLILLAQMDEYLLDMIAFEQEKSDAGLFMSDEAARRVIDSCYAFLENSDSHYLLTTFENRLHSLDLTMTDREEYLRQNHNIFTQQIIPAYETMITELTALLGTGTNSGGVCHFPEGKTYYKLLVASETGCDDSIDTLFSRIEHQRNLDLLICSDHYEQTPDIYEECLNLSLAATEPKAMLTMLQTKMDGDFPVPPISEYSIKYVDPALTDYLAPAFYIVAPIDQYLENSIYINNADDSSAIDLFVTLAHEGFPGHLYQTVMSYEYEMLPVRSLFNYDGFVEGWATYIEMMAYGYSGIHEDYASYLSCNQSAVLSLYASSDIGLHYYGWTRDEMVDFWSSYGIRDEDTINEITQHILSAPGNYLKYYIGYLEFLDLKTYAKNTYGADFDLMEFHRTLLDIGPAPFDIVREYFPEFYKLRRY